MPARAHQSTPRFAEGAGAVLPAPSGECLLSLVVPDGATDNVNWTGLAGLSFRVVEVHVEKRAGAGGAGDTIQLQTAAGVAITDAIDVNVADGIVVRATLLDDATHIIPAGIGLRVRRTNGAAGGNVLNCVVRVKIAIL